MAHLNGAETLGIFKYLKPGEDPVGFVGPVVETENGRRRQLAIANLNVEHIGADGKRGRIERIEFVPVPDPRV